MATAENFRTLSLGSPFEASGISNQAICLDARAI
jgi:hypothetical protein